MANKKPAFITSGNLEAGGQSLRLLATTPANPSVYATLTRPPLKGKARTDFVGAFNKVTGKLGHSFAAPGAYASLSVVP